MGKDLKGKELGAGIVQRKDGKYAARFVGKTKKRTEKHFDKVSEAKKWLELLSICFDFADRITDRRNDWVKMGRHRFPKKTISVKRTMEFRYGDQEFRIGEPKSKAGCRTIPMTQTAYDILKAKEKNRYSRLADSAEIN